MIPNEVGTFMSDLTYKIFTAFRDLLSTHWIIQFAFFLLCVDFSVTVYKLLIHGDDAQETQYVIKRKNGVKRRL